MSEMSSSACGIHDVDFLTAENIDVSWEGISANSGEKATFTVSVLNSSQCKAVDTKLTVWLVGPALFPIYLVGPVEIDKWARLVKAVPKEHKSTLDLLEKHLLPWGLKRKVFDVGDLMPNEHKDVNFEVKLTSVGELGAGLSIKTKVCAFLIPKGCGPKDDHSNAIWVHPKP